MKYRKPAFTERPTTVGEYLTTLSEQEDADFFQGAHWFNDCAAEMYERDEQDTQ